MEATVTGASKWLRNSISSSAFPTSASVVGCESIRENKLSRTSTTPKFIPTKSKESWSLSGDAYANALNVGLSMNPQSSLLGLSLYKFCVANSLCPLSLSSSAPYCFRAGYASQLEKSRMPPRPSSMALSSALKLIECCGFGVMIWIEKMNGITVSKKARVNFSIELNIGSRPSLDLLHRDVDCAASRTGRFRGGVDPAPGHSGRPAVGTCH